MSDQVIIEHKQR